MTDWKQLRNYHCQWDLGCKLFKIPCGESSSNSQGQGTLFLFGISASSNFQKTSAGAVLVCAVPQALSRSPSNIRAAEQGAGAEARPALKSVYFAGIRVSHNLSQGDLFPAMILTCEAKEQRSKHTMHKAGMQLKKQKYYSWPEGNMNGRVCVWGLEAATDQQLKEWSVLITEDVTDCTKIG